MSSTTKRCPGFGPDGIAPHELAATLEFFNSNRGSKDGLSTRCRDCGNRYSRAWSAAKKAGERFSVRAHVPLVVVLAEPARPPQLEALEDAMIDEAIATSEAAAERIRAEERPATLHVVGSSKPSPQYANELAVRAGRKRAKGYTTEVVGGLIYALPESPAAIASEEGQAALELVNEARAADRRRRDAERKRASRAAAKAAAQA